MVIVYAVVSVVTSVVFDTTVEGEELCPSAQPAETRHCVIKQRPSRRAPTWPNMDIQSPSLSL